MTPSYSQRFQDAAAVADYESKEYGTGSYSSCIWRLQLPILHQIISDFRRGRAGRPMRLLDFACGTGRVISGLEPLVDEATGIDISPNMVGVARGKCRSAQLHVGDILTQPDLLAGPYDVVTAFRFLLNVEPDLRRRALERLRSMFREPDGLLLVNVHGNSRSLRHPAIVWHRWRERARPTGAMLNEMSPGESAKLLQECGFQIVTRYGFGMLPPTFYRTPLQKLVAVADRSLAGENGWSAFAIDMLYVCRPVDF